jgi:site-specific recombinase XerD
LCSVAIDPYQVQKHIKPLLGHLKVPAVTKYDVEEFRDKLSRGTATRTIAFLGALFTFAVKRGLRPDNPVRGVETYAIQHRQRRMTDAEYAALGKAISAMPNSWPMAPGGNEVFGAHRLAQW